MTDQAPEASANDLFPESAFRVHSWEIWYTYACYLSEDISDLREAAEKLLKHKFGDVIILPTGEVGYRHQGATGWGSVSEEDDIGVGRTELHFTDVPEELRGSVVRLALARSAARNVFSFHAPISDPYIHIALPDVVAYQTPDHSILLEVAARVYQSGIALFSFRSRLTSEDGVSLDSFIYHHVNLAQRPLHALENDKDISELILDAYIRDEITIPRIMRVPYLKVKAPLPRRIGILALRSHRDALIHRIDLPEAPPLAPGRIRVKGRTTSQLSGVALEYARGLAYALGHPRQGIRYLLLGEPDEPSWTGYWDGSPHVHLLEFSEQSESAEENERRHKGSFLWTLARTPPHEGRGLRIELPKSMRSFDDYGVYVGESTLLWVYTKDPSHQDRGRGSFDDPLSFPTSHHQVKGDLLEYGRILYQSLQGEFEAENLNWDKIFLIRERQVRFELDLHQTGRFGEIKDFIEEGFRARRIETLKEQMASLLSLREDMASVGENRRLAMTGITFAYLLGFLGLPGAIDFLNANVAPHVNFLAALDVHAPARIGALTVATLSLLFIPLISLPLFKRKRWIPRRGRIKRT
jgi:hypothetical protein